MKRIWMKVARVSADLTQAQLAEKCETSDSMISMIENGQRNPSRALAKRICEALSVSDLFNSDDDPAATA